MTTATTQATTAATSPTPRIPATTPATTAEAGAVELTLAPVALGEFEAGYRDRRPLVVPRDEPGRFDSVLAWADVERMVGESGLRSPAFRLVRDGAPLPLHDHASDVPWRPGSFSGLADVDRVAREHAAGATLVLQALHLHWHPAAIFCRGLEQALGFPVQANAYATPAGAQGFAVHHDTHDVFVLQVSGSKRWRIYEPVLELPLKTQRWSPQLGDPGPPVHDLTLNPGDTLYLPRGWPHEATSQAADSLHLTIGLHPPTRLDALRQALDACASDVEFRRALAPDGCVPTELLARLADRLEPTAVAARARRRFVASRRPVLGDQLAQAKAAAALTGQDLVERRPTVIAELGRDGEAVVLHFEGKEVRLPARAGAAVDAAFGAEDPFRAADLPGPLDEAGRLVLVRRLVLEGFLMLHGSAKPS